jgi:two-component system, response regulator PdtaR
MTSLMDGHGTAPPRFRVLVVEDDVLIADFLVMAVKDAGAEVIGVADTGAAALSLADMARPDLAVLDVKLAGPPDGIIVGQVLSTSHGSLLIFVTGSGDPATRSRIDALRPFGFLQKPFRLQQLVDLILDARRRQGSLLGSCT